MLVPATAAQGADLFASFFAPAGVFQSPGGILRGQAAIRAGFFAYASNPGEENQHVINHKFYWDERTSTLTVERTWFATLTALEVFAAIHCQLVPSTAKTMPSLLGLPVILIA